MSTPPQIDRLSTEIDAALALLDDYASKLPAEPVAESLPSLMAQCAALSDAAGASEPVRSLHHFACSGGTLIAKVMAGLPGVVLLNEIDPLSNIRLTNRRKKPPFAPTDIFIGLRQSLRAVDEGIICTGFAAAVSTMATALARQGQSLLIRDHAHSQFCTAVDPAGRPTVREMLAPSARLLSLVTVRHPLDSFASLHHAGWVQFAPPTLEEYCARYLLFLERHADLPILKYEDFVTEPKVGLKKICRLMELPFHDLAFDMIPIIRVSGDSGRSGPEITTRPRRPLPDEIEAQRDSGSYLALCRRLDYEA